MCAIKIFLGVKWSIFIHRDEYSLLSSIGLWLFKIYGGQYVANDSFGFPVYDTIKYNKQHAIFADLVPFSLVFKIQVEILKSMQYAAFRWDFIHMTHNHESNTNNNI